MYLLGPMQKLQPGSQVHFASSEAGRRLPKVVALQDGALMRTETAEEFRLLSLRLAQVRHRNPASRQQTEDCSQAKLQRLAANAVLQSETGMRACV